MANAQPAMRPTPESVEEVLNRVTGPKRHEAERLLALHHDVSGREPVVWAGRIIGFGEHHYQYESGHEGDVPELAFASSNRMHTVYLSTGFAEHDADLLLRLGPHRASKACLYFTRLSNVDVDVLAAILKRTLERVRAAPA